MEGIIPIAGCCFFRTFWLLPKGGIENYLVMDGNGLNGDGSV